MLEDGNRTAVPCGIDVRDSDAIPGAHRGAERAIICAECGEQLDRLAVEIDENDPLPVSVERRDGRGLVLDAALESQCRLRSEPEDEVPEGPNYSAFEEKAEREGGQEKHR